MLQGIQQVGHAAEREKQKLQRKRGYTMVIERFVQRLFER